MNTVYFTGGPGSGKTSTLTWLKRHLNGESVYFLDEVHQSLFGSPDLATLKIMQDVYEKQLLIAKVQMLLEKTLSSVLPSDTEGILICDRGIFDVYGFVSGDEAKRILSGITPLPTHTCLFFESPTTDENISKDTSTFRVETFSQGLDQAVKLKRAWSKYTLPCQFFSIKQYESIQQKGVVVGNLLNIHFGRKVFSV